MSAIAPPDPAQASQTVSKKKSNKKKKSKNKANGEASKGLEVTTNGAANDDDAGDNEAEDVESSTVSTPQIESFSENAGQSTNGHPKSPVKSNMESPVSAAAAKDILEDSMESVGSDTTDASSRLEAMSADREALRAEVEKLRKALEDIRATHTEEISTIRTELEESEAAKEQAQNQYQNLLGRVNTIKSTLGERLQADRQELAEATDKIEELEGENEALRNKNAETDNQIEELEKEAREAQRELSILRNRHNLSQQNWVNEREELLTQTRQLREEAEAAKEAMGDWEVLAMEERSIREGLADRVAELEDQLSSQREGFERAASERDSQSQAVDGLQRALQAIQEARRVELREMVESTQAQVEALNKLVAEAEARADLAETAKKALEAELERAAPFEKEVKEKNLLIGKLRHEAIILNDHLAKALRFLKKAKPEDNIDRQIVTNHFLHFLALDRSDPKKFQILQIISALLNWTDEQKEQAGLARPGASSSSLRLPLSPFHRTPSTPSLSTEFFPGGEGISGSSVTVKERESLAELWTGFLERQAEEGGKQGGRSASVSSAPPPGKS